MNFYLQILTYIDINDQKKLVLISASSDLGSESVTECCKQKKTNESPEATLIYFNYK
jgi:hypothetical protein